MILLSGRSLTPARKVPVESMSLQLKERDSTATVTPADMTGIQVNSWLKDETDPGAGIVWRVKSIQQAYATQTPTVQLEHAVSTLKDAVLFGEHKAAQITGNAKATTCTAKQAVQYILRQQGDWALGSFDYANVSNPYKFDGDDLFSALETVSSSLEECWWSYDFSTYPFRLNITRKATGVGSEMRASRNLKTITRTIDKSGMFTRFYPIGANDLHIDGDYVQKNVNLYGVVSKVETDQSIDTKDELLRWANERVNSHAEPTVTIDVEGFDLAKDTGESLDSMKLGRLCRIPLPEYGTEIQERIITLTYSDKVHQPEVFKATLANNKTDITKIVADALKKGGRGGRAAARREKQDLAWFEDTNDHVSMCAIGIIGVNAKGEPDWIRMTEVTADGTGLHSTVQSVQKEQVIQQTRLDQDERSIGMVVETSPDGKTMIKAGEICLAINESKESTATINAKKIYLLGKTIADTISAEYISSKIADIPTLRGLSALFTGNIASRSSVIAPYIYLGTGGPELGTGIQYVRINGPSSNVYTLQYKTFRNTSWQDAGSFSRAVTSWDVGWSDSKWTAKAQPQNQSVWVQIYQGTSSWSGRTVTIPIRSVSSQSGTEVTAYSATATYTMAKSDISLTRSGRSGSQPSTDAALTNLYVTQNGWYTFTVTAAGTSKTFRMQITVPEE